MRDNRDAKAMARRLREALAEKGLAVHHSDCLELIARSFGFKDWHVLAATIEAAAPATDAAPAAAPPTWSGPVLLLRDIVIFPKQTAPVFVGRDMSIRALQRAYEGELEVLLVTQKDRDDDSPAVDAVYGVGVIADVLERFVVPDGTLKLLVRGRQRARVLAVAEEGGYRRAEAAVAPSPAADFPGAAAAVRDAAAAFEAWAAADGRVTDAMRAWAAGVTSAAVLADLIAAIAKGSIADKQAILETADPRQRLQRAVRLLHAPGVKAA